ncbi:MAG: ferric reductase-like transmembrane domain-containing protein [Burkholderiaceae bacterium]|jgi:predicted ferric reductase|nr:ferric reductase-like transmembrane domain-containing protein [Burkholderiaceae bacterium]
MIRLLWGIPAVVVLAWTWSALAGLTPLALDASVWTLRKELIYVSGVAAFSMMSVIMLLATRPAWLEKPLGGMDRIYRLHKWAGILAISLAAGHWLLDLSGGVLRAFFAKPVKGPHDTLTWAEPLRGIAKDLGEWSVYLLLAMLVLTLWKLVPYRFWRRVHRVMPVFYLALALHAIVLFPASLWAQPIGAMLAIAVAIGAYGSVVSLLGEIGRTRRMHGRVRELGRTGDVLSVRCAIDSGWREAKPGQFAFVTFDAAEGAHPFTISSVDAGQRSLGFEIKALGDYTAQLRERLSVGMPVRVEGPYGQFDFRRGRSTAHQVWVAGGIGVTPFIAWLESLARDPSTAPHADFHYCVRNRDTDALVARVESLCARVPSVRLTVHSDDRDPALHARMLCKTDANEPIEVWFCGPGRFAEALREGLAKLGLGSVRFHQEAFEMR